MLAQRRRRWADVVQMLQKCFVFDGIFMIMLSYFCAIRKHKSSANYKCRAITYIHLVLGECHLVLGK